MRPRSSWITMSNSSRVPSPKTSAPRTLSSTRATTAPRNGPASAIATLTHCAGVPSRRSATTVTRGGRRDASNASPQPGRPSSVRPTIASHAPSL
jgi:hypothetical protein